MSTNFDDFVSRYTETKINELITIWGNLGIKLYRHTNNPVQLITNRKNNTDPYVILEYGADYWHITYYNKSRIRSILSTNERHYNMIYGKKPIVFANIEFFLNHHSNSGLNL